jgi:branched-chain amino acid transport system substrate-binding protein
VRWGLENLALDAAAIKKLGFTGFMDPIQTTCVDHEGSHSAHVETWDGKKWSITAGPYESDLQIIKPIIRASAAKYAGEKKVPARDCAKDASS